ncbi:hypothetical protein [Vreelandella jeotgali]|uniref:hypothetical protein n=1 Tax=Vreelandella jeotgali TaxID=553386 RepID=UPI0012E9A45C|nr:hypothetical protein [Halomonas jeotgali]
MGAHAASAIEQWFKLIDRLVLFPADPAEQALHAGSHRLDNQGQQQKAIVEGFAKTDLPVVRLSMLGAKGLIGCYGRVYGREEIEALGV